MFRLTARLFSSAPGASSHFRFGVPAHAVESLPPLVQQVLAPTNASAAEIRTLDLRKKTADFALHEFDTGSPEVQIARLTYRISALTDHLRMHKKDKSAGRGLSMLVEARKKHVKYLKREDPQRFASLAARLNLR